jgi:guanylate kinase
VQSGDPTLNQDHPLLIILSGPSGAGKDAVLARMRELGHQLHYTVTATTRPQRSLERDGEDYIFLTSERFDRMVSEDGFLEWAQVYGHRYGVPKKQVQDALRAGKDTVIKTDVQGAATIRRQAPDALLIFLVPPALEDLEPRLRQRKTEGDVDMELRLRTARAEIGHAAMFDHVVVNHDGRLDEAVQSLIEIIATEKRRDPPRRVAL